MRFKDIEYQIRQLKKIKKNTPIKTQARRDINKQIRELKEQKKVICNITPEKEKLIEEIIKLQPEFIRLKINLGKHSIEDLQKHLNKIKEK